MKRYVLGFYFDDDRVLLINKLKPEWQRGKVNGLGGSIEFAIAETPIEAMVREFEEESGIKTSPRQWELVATLWGDETLPKTGTDWEMFVYRGAGAIPAMCHRTDEGEVSAYHVLELPPNMEQTARWLVALCYDKSGIRAEIRI